MKIFKICFIAQCVIINVIGNWRKFIESKNSWILELSDKKSNEELRPNKEVTSDIFSSMFGFFRIE